CRCENTAVSSCSEPSLKWNTSRLVTRLPTADCRRSPSASGVPSSDLSERKPCTRPSLWRTLTSSPNAATPAESTTTSATVSLEIHRAIVVRLSSSQVRYHYPRQSSCNSRGDRLGGARIRMTIVRDTPGRIDLYPEIWNRGFVENPRPQRVLHIVFRTELRDNDQRRRITRRGESNRCAEDVSRRRDPLLDVALGPVGDEHHRERSEPAAA